MINEAQDSLVNSTMKLVESDELAKNISSLDVPSLTSATELATNINKSIIPDSNITDLLTDANDSAIAAMERLQGAMNTRYHHHYWFILLVLLYSAMVSELEYKINNLTSDIEEARARLETAEQTYNDTTRNTEYINDTLREVQSTTDA